MPELIRRLANAEGQPQRCLIWYDDMNVGQIRERQGAPLGSDQWEWFCGFYSGSLPGDQRMGTAATFDLARVDFERAWNLYKQKRAPADFRAWRHQHAWTEAKYVAWDLARSRRLGRCLALRKWTQTDDRKTARHVCE